MNGEKLVLSVKIEKDAANDVEMLQDLITAAVNEASRKVDAAVQSQLGGLLGGLGCRPDCSSLREESEMGRQVAGVLYAVAMAAVIVGVDFVFFRNRFLERLTVNIGIVLVFAAFYWRFLRHP